MPAREASSSMFGIGVQEMVIVGLLSLAIFGPGKLPDMARDFGRFVSEARRTVDEFKGELVSEEESGREPHTARVPGASREPEENVQHKAAAAIDRSAPHTEQL